MPSSTAFPSSPRNSIPSIQTNGAPLRRWPPLEEIVQDDPEASSFDASGTELPQPPSRSEPKYHTLFCGSSLASELDQQSQSCFREGSSWAPSPFPEVPEKHDAEPESPPTNGCGALLHLRAIPKNRLGVFTAKSFASNQEEMLLAPLDPKYFIDIDLTIGSSGAIQFVKSSCGCERIGIGCAVCGNPLGTRFKPCTAATTGSDSTLRNLNSKPVGPDGRGYWRLSSVPETPTRPTEYASTSSSKEPNVASSTSAPEPPREFYIYTFFPSAVTPSPSFTFTARHSTSSASLQRTPSPPERFFVDPTLPPLISPSVAWASFADEWQPPSPVRLSFVDQPGGILRTSPDEIGNGVVTGGRPSRRESWTLGPPVVAESLDDWDKDIWESRMVVAGR